MNARTRVWMLFLLLWVLAGCLATPQTGQKPASTPSPATVMPTMDKPSDTAFLCPVTQPNGHPPPAEVPNSYHHGNSELYTELWPDGKVVFKPDGPGSIDPSGSLRMKFPWWRGSGVRGRLTIEGQRLDAPAPPLQANIPDGYGESGFQASLIIFPTEGCWQVTGRAGKADLTFVTLVVKVS